VSGADRIVVALDLGSAAEALDLVDALGPDVGVYKVGAQLFTREGPRFVDALKKREKRIFLDLKFHDIPNTVRGAVRSAAERGVDMLTVHASGGVEMLAAAREAAGEDGPTVLAVTLLTSLATEEVEQIFGRSPLSLVDEVVRLAGLAVEAELDGVVASVTEVKSIRRRHGADLMIVTPGIRLVGDDPADQTRYATPEDAARAGADYIVVGRSITGADDPEAAFRSIARAFEVGRIDEG
jgi:orotidine-5'-phosphate decarboxylase